MVYCLFEETGWRGFLQDAGSLKFGLLIHLPSCILGSWGIGVMADKYKSLLVVGE